MDIVKRNKWGQFVKHHPAWNRGKTWAETGISPESQAKMLKCLDIGRRKKGCRRTWLCRSKRIICVLNGRIVGHFRNSVTAGRKLGVQSRNIRKVRQGLRKTAGGYVFWNC